MMSRPSNVRFLWNFCFQMFVVLHLKGVKKMVNFHCFWQLRHNLKAIFKQFKFFDFVVEAKYVHYCCLKHCWRRLGLLLKFNNSKIASASVLIGLHESECFLCGFCWTIGNVFLGGMRAAMICGLVNCFGNGLFLVRRLVRNSEIGFCGALSPVAMWWACPRRSWLALNAGSHQPRSFRYHECHHFSLDQCLDLINRRPTWAEYFPSSLWNLFYQAFGLHNRAHVLMNRWFSWLSSQVVE